MPFSMAGGSENRKCILFIISVSKYKIKKIIVTLQVRILSFKIFCHHSDSRGKRAFPSVPAALALEAALALSLFIFAATCLILPMKMMNTERRIQAALEKAGEDFSKYAYIKYEIEQGKLLSVAGADDFAKGFCDYLAAGIGEGYVQAQVMQYVDTDAVKKVTFGKSEIMTDGAFIDLVMEYEIRLPFPVLGLPALQRTARCRRRAWVGMAGKDYDGDGGSAEDGMDMIVYIGKNSTRYHKSRNCHYLSNDLKKVALGSVDALRNSGGKRYKPCAVCGSHASGTVYVMQSGGSYHSNPDCRAIISYAKAVRLSEAEHLGPCSYCGK